MKYIKYDIKDDNIEAYTTLVEAGNFAYQVGDNHQEVKDNRKALFEELGIDFNKATFTHQSHSDVVEEVTMFNVGMGKVDFVEGIEADGLYTKQKGVPVAIFHADCVPVLFYDPTIPLVGVIHSGYKGTLKHATKTMLGEVIKRENLNLDNIRVFIGPYRHKETFKIENDEDFEKIIMNYLPIEPDKHYDMGAAVRIDLMCLGISMDNVVDINIDTAKDDRCFSAYKKTPIGRMSSFILIK